MPTIRKRGDKWQVQIRRGGHPLTSKTFTLRTNAERWARQTEAAIERGDQPLFQSIKGHTLKDLLVRYRETVTTTKRGAEAERYRIGTMLNHPIAGRSLANLTPSDIAKYRDDRLTIVASASVRRELVILRHCLEVARKEWNVPLSSNPVALIRMPVGAKPRERRLEGDELKHLLEGCSQRRSSLLPLIIQFAIHTGMRRGEILSFHWSDVDMDCATLHITMSKNGHARTIPLTPQAIDLLKKMPREGQKVFPVSANALRLSWERLKKRVGIDDLRFHDLRHEAISRFFEMGLSVPEVALISGHRDARMLFRYTHLRAEDVSKKLLEANTNPQSVARTLRSP